MDAIYPEGRRPSRWYGRSPVRGGLDHHLYGVHDLTHGEVAGLVHARETGPEIVAWGVEKKTPLEPQHAGQPAERRCGRIGWFRTVYGEADPRAHPHEVILDDRGAALGRQEAEPAYDEPGNH